jgi:hypothetical protein
MNGDVRKFTKSVTIGSLEPKFEAGILSLRHLEVVGYNLGQDICLSLLMIFLDI